MGIERVGTFDVFQKTMSDVGKIDNEITNLQNQISSGFKSQNFAGISDSALQFLDLQNRLARADQYLGNNGVIKVRLSSTNTALTQIINTATDLKNLILQRRDATNDVGTFQTQITAIWKTLTGQLNLNVDGRYIFAGGRTDQKAVNDTSFPQITNGTNTNYYQGDDQDLNVRISDNVDMTYNVRADGDGFSKLFAGLAMASDGDTANSDEKLSQAYDLIADGIKGVISAQAKNNSNLVDLDNNDQSLTAQKTYWKGVKEELGNTDLISASTQVAVDQGILQATFQVFARINSLRLADYLK
jgi:flagellar hook-associated protein 3 FlgL